MDVRARYLDHLRQHELARLIARWPQAFHDRDLLEIGSGTGAQLQVLTRICRSAVGLELESSPYAARRVASIMSYDGRHIPFPDQSFDTLFSSNVLEHVQDQATLQRECLRVLRPGGTAIHLLPSHYWRLWTSLAHYPALPRLLLERTAGADAPAARGVSEPSSLLRTLLKALVPPRHGEEGSGFTELLTFRPQSWHRRLGELGWAVATIAPGGVFYTGQMLLHERLSFPARERLASVLGSSCYVFVLRRQAAPAAVDANLRAEAAAGPAPAR